jgi:hypothetical protein
MYFESAASNADENFIISKLYRLCKDDQIFFVKIVENLTKI